MLKADVSDAGEGWSDSRIIKALDTTASMVYRVRKQLVEEGFEAVLSRKQRATPAVARIFDGEKEAKLIALACSKPPKGRARWTLRLLENKVVELFPAKAKIHKVKHFRALELQHLPDFMAKLRAVEGTMARALEFTILCAVRTGETRGATWREFDLDAKQATWTIPRLRMKVADDDEDQRVPLAPQVVALLRARRDDGPDPDALVFATSTGRAIGPEEMLKVVKRLGYTVTVHGFRSCFSDWAFADTHHTFMEIEISLAHRVGGKTHESYRRGDLFDRRAILMALWADYLVPPAAAGNVIPMQASA